MGCKQKKQNNNQGGVHLTERTCSPYNPIIKQIVDDCLGLPIYPVTSVDAVIDENGDTLRKLLQDLLDQIKEGSFNTQQLQQMIEEALGRLSDIYASKEALNDLKALLWAISSIMSKSDNPTESDLYITGTSIPKIVDAVRRLQDIVCALTGTCEGQSGEDIPSIIDLKELLDILQDILVAIANFDTTYTVVDGNDLGLETKDNNARIKIIQEILDIKSLIGDGDEEGTPPDGGSLVQKIQWLIDNVKQLLTESKTHAHLDPKVLEQMPEEVEQGQSENARDLYKTLRAAELPPTTVIIARNAGDIEINNNYPLYVGNISPVSAGNLLDFYPFGHTNSNEGYPLFYKAQNGQYVAVETSNGTQLRAGNGQFTGDDIIFEVKSILSVEAVPEFDTTPKYEQENLFRNNNYRLSNFYVKVGNSYYAIGDVQKINEVKISGLNEIISTLQSSQQSQPAFQMPIPYSNNISKGWLILFDTDLNPALYPCIKGKTYVDATTGNLYVYESNNMHQVANSKFVGNGITVTKTFDFDNPSAEKKMLRDPYTEYMFSLDPQTLLLKSNDEFVNFEIQGTELPTTTLAKYNVKCDLEYDENQTSGALYYLDSQTIEVIPKTTYINANSNPYEQSPIYDFDDFGVAPGFFAYFGKAFISNMINSLTASKQQAEAEGDNDQVRELEARIQDLREKLANASPIPKPRSLIIWPNDSDAEHGVEITGSYTQAFVLSQMLDFDEDGCFTPDDVYILSGLSGSTAEPKEINTGVMLKRYRDDSQVTIDSSPEVIGRIFEVIGANEEKSLYYFNEQGDFRPLHPEYSLTLSNIGGYVELRRDQEIISKIDILQAQQENVTNSVPTNVESNESARTKLLIAHTQNQEINLGDDADPFFLGSPLYSSLDLENENYYDNKLNVKVGTQFYIGTSPNPSAIDLANTPYPLRNLFIQDTLNEVEKIKSDILIPLYLALEENPELTSAEIEDIIDDCLTYNPEYTQFKMHSNYVNLNGEAAIKNCYLYTIKKTVIFSIGEIDHTQDYAEQLTSTVIIDVVDKVTVKPKLIYYFPKYDLKLSFNIENYNGLFYYEPAILFTGSRQDITSKNINLDGSILTANLYPNYLETIESAENTIALNVQRIVNIPGYKQIPIKGMIKFLAETSGSMSLLMNALYYPMTTNNSSHTVPGSSQIGGSQVVPVNVSVEQIRPDVEAIENLSHSSSEILEYTIFNGYINLKHKVNIE